MDRVYFLMAWMLARMLTNQRRIIAIKDEIIESDSRLIAGMRQALDLSSRIIAELKESNRLKEEQIRLRDEYMASRGVLPTFARKAAG